MNRTHIFALALVPLLAVACTSKEGQQAQGGEQGMAEQAGQMGQQAMGGMQTVTLSPKNDSGVTGTVEFSAAGSDSVQVKVSLMGIEPGTEYPTHIHHGSCASEGGVAQPLASVTGQADSTGTSTTTVAHSLFMPDSSYFVQAHGADMSPVACGDIPATPHDGGMSDSSSMGSDGSM
jgi:hypothetical protein